MICRFWVGIHNVAQVCRQSIVAGLCTDLEIGSGHAQNFQALLNTDVGPLFARVLANQRNFFISVDSYKNKESKRIVVCLSVF